MPSKGQLSENLLQELFCYIKTNYTACINSDTPFSVGWLSGSPSFSSFPSLGKVAQMMKSGHIYVSKQMWTGLPWLAFLC